MGKVKRYSRVTERKPLEGNTVSQLEKVLERQGSRRRYFVLKHTRLPENELVEWNELHRTLRALKVPTSPYFRFFLGRASNKVKQKDYSVGGKVKVVDAWQVPHITAENERAFLGIIYDLGRLHSAGITLGPNERLTAPWLLYKKPNGKMERALVDYGSLHQGGPKTGARGNFEILMPFLNAQRPEFIQKALTLYFRANPDPSLKGMAHTFFGRRF